MSAMHPNEAHPAANTLRVLIAEAAAAPEVPESLPCGRGERILLVDDHAFYRGAMQSLLEVLGYCVTAFGSPLEALAAFRAQPESYDAAFTDLSMREMNGLELARQLLAARPDIPIIVSSGYELSGIAKHVRDLGIREVLAKPVQCSRLAESVARALSQRETTAPAHRPTPRRPSLGRSPRGPARAQDRQQAEKF